jgi:hypothetical protein
MNGSTFQKSIFVLVDDCQGLVPWVPRLLDSIERNRGLLRVGPLGLRARARRPIIETV